MTDHVPARDWRQVRADAIARARLMGYRTDTDTQDTRDDVQLPTASPTVLRALLNADQLTPAQAARARKLLKDAQRIARQEAAS